MCSKSGNLTYKKSLKNILSTAFNFLFRNSLKEIRTIINLILHLTLKGQCLRKIINLSLIFGALNKLSYFDIFIMNYKPICCKVIFKNRVKYINMLPSILADTLLIHNFEK